MPSPTEITVQQLARLIGLPDSPVIVDVRTNEDFEDDPRLIPSAFRHPYGDIAALTPDLADVRVVVVCQKGLKISQGAAAVLRDRGVAAEYLAGGSLAWRDAKEPLISAARIPPRNTEDRTLWVTRHRPKIDRMACPWLIRRFVDRNARFLFVSPSEVQDVADRFDATPFDIEDVFWSHRGDRCTFDTMIEEFALETLPLQRLARIVRGADTNHLNLAAESAGLLAASLGLSRMYRDDLTQLQAGMGLYDAFYRWARDAVDEGHNWPSPSARS